MAVNVPRVPLPANAYRPVGGDSARSAIVSPFPQTSAKAAIAEAGKAFDFLGAEWKRQRIDADQIKAVEYEGQYLKRVDEKVAALDPLSTDYAERVKAIHAEEKQAVFDNSQLSTREVKDELARRIERMSQTGELTAAAGRRKAIENEAVRTYVKSQEEVYAAIRKDPDGYEAHLARFTADAARLRGGISPENQRQLAEKFADGALLAKVDGLVEKGRLGDANKFIDQNQGSMSPEHYRWSKGQVRQKEAEMRADAARGEASQYATVHADLAKRMFDEGAKFDFNSERLRLETALKEGKINIKTFAAAQDMVLAQQKHVLVEQEKTTRATGLFVAGTLRESADVARVWSELVAKGAMKETAEHWAAFAAQSGHLPPHVKTLLENADAGANPNDPKAVERLASAASVFVDMEKTLGSEPHGVLSKVQSPRVRAVLEQQRLTQSTMQEAARTVLLNTPQTEQDAKARQQAYEATLKNNTFTDALKSTFSPGVGRLDPVVDPAVAAEAKRVALDLVARGHPLESATASAIAEVRTRFGVTHVGNKDGVLRNAGGTLVRDPIERSFPAATPPEFDARLRAKVVDEQVAELAKRRNLQLNEKADLPAYKLTPTQAGGTTRWALSILDKEGLAYIPTGNTILPPADLDALNRSPVYKAWKEEAERELQHRRGARDVRERRK